MRATCKPLPLALSRIAPARASSTAVPPARVGPGHPCRTCSRTPAAKAVGSELAGAVRAARGSTPVRLRRRQAAFGLTGLLQGTALAVGAGREVHMAAEASESGTAGGRIDAHLHVWASPDEAQRFPYFPGQEPTLPGSEADLAKAMEAAEVRGALIVQPINHKFDHAYVSSVLQAHPKRYLGCCLANPAADGRGVADLRDLLTEGGFRAVRFNPYLWPQGEKMSNRVGREMFALAGSLGAPVGFMCFKGLMLHIEDIEELCGAHPETPVLMDHFGFCRSPFDAAHSTDADKEAWDRLLGLARFPQVHVKLSAFFRVSRQPYPHEDTWPMIRQLADAFGAHRLMWGSDFPFVESECGYTAAWDILPPSLLTPAERALVLGGTARALFPGAWA